METSITPGGIQRIRPDLDLTWELESEFTSSDSDATVAGLAGPGRTIGLAYDWAGGRLEDQLRKFSFARTRRKAVESTDSLSTNATADNLPGPGRSLGLAFGWGGLRLEKRLNKLAEKFGYGPRAAEAKLKEFGRRYSVYVSSVELGEWDKEKKTPEFLHDKSARKAGRQLLKYSKSRVEVTQVQALDSIIDLCYKEPLLQELFSELSGVNVLQAVHASSDTDSLLSSSRKALVFVSDTQINTLFHQFRYNIAAPTIEQYTELTGHLLDPYSSFIILRFLVDRIYLHTDNLIFRALLNLVEKDSGYTDWKALDSALSFALIYGKSHLDTHCLGLAIVPVLSHAEKLPRSTVALKGAFTVDITAWDEFLSGPSEQVCRALEHFTGSCDIDVHVASAAKIERLLREFIHPWPKELQNLVDEPTVIFCHVFRRRRTLPKAVYRSLRCERAVERSEIEPHCRRLVTCLQSSKEDIQFRAFQVVHAILGLDRYCARYLLDAFSDANRGKLAGSSSLVPYARQFRAREYGEGISPDDAGFLRHMSVEGTFHISRPEEEGCVGGCVFKSCNHLRDDDDSTCKRCGMGREFRLALNEHALLWLHHTRNAPIDTSVHDPILVGTSQSGAKEFIAFVDEGEGFWTTFRESDLVVKYPKKDGSWATTDKFYIPVLRFDLSELLELFPDIPEGGLDPTGPFYWRPYDAMYEIFEDEDLMLSSSDLIVRESFVAPIPLRSRRAHTI